MQDLDPRLVAVAIVCIVFDAALAFLLPVAVVFKRLVADGHGVRTLAEVLAFVGVLLIAFAYVRKRGDLDWARPEASPENDG